MKTSSILISALALTFSSALVNGQYIAQNGLGSVVTSSLTPLTGAASVADFYNYGSASYNGSVTFSNQTINSFFFEDTSGGLSFVTVYGTKNGNRRSSAVSVVELTGATGDFAIQDDDPSGRDEYTVSNGGTLFESTNFWRRGNTDGFAIFEISGFTQLVQTIEESNRVNDWYLHSGNGDTFNLSLNDDLILTPVPEPTTIGLIAVTALPLLLLVRRRLLKK